MNWRVVLAFVAFALLFEVVNRGAYQGYFDGDDLDNLAWTAQTKFSDYVVGLLSPQLQANNFRPAGHFVYALGGRLWGLDFPRYIRLIHLLHFVNVALLWRWLRCLDLPLWPAAAGALVFACHMGAFDIYWKPMYVFDLLCATFCVLSLLAWTNRRFWWALAAFWCAYKAKEVAILFPVALLALDWARGQLWNWRVAPFFAVSLSFGGQALWANGARDNDYSLRFSLDALRTTLSFYLAKLGSLAFLPARRLPFGIALFALFLTPLLFLPGRLFGAYLYVPLLGVAVAVAALAARLPRAVTAILLLLWLGWNFQAMRRERRAYLTQAQDNQTWVSAVERTAGARPLLCNFVLDGIPPALKPWGVRGALRVITAHNPTCAQTGGTRIAELDSPEAQAIYGDTERDTALLRWNAGLRTTDVRIRERRQPLAAFLEINEATPEWQLGDGWRGREGTYRWTFARATASLAVPPNARVFTVKVNIGPQLIQRAGRVELDVLINGQLAGQGAWSESGWYTLVLPVRELTESVARVEFRARPGVDGLGIPISAFGFAAAQRAN
jgi:hypothetical protein